MQTHEYIPRKVDLINASDETLEGLSDKGHLFWLGEQLARLGFPLRKGVVVRDDDGGLAREFAKSWEDADIIITVGGMGMRYDDTMRETVARVLKKKLIYDKTAEKVLADALHGVGRRQLCDLDLVQCWIMEGSELLPNVKSPAPGIFFQENGKLLFMLPGDPEALRNLFAKFVIPKLTHLHATPREHFVQIRVAGGGILRIEDTIRHLIDQAKMHFVTSEQDGIVDVRLMSGKSGLEMQDILKLVHEIRAVLGDDFICTGTHTLPQIIYEQLHAHNRTIAVAESCTGGLLSGAITGIPGASKIFHGGVVCYSDDAKHALGVPSEILQQHGAVSAECALALASEVAEKFGTDYGLSVTGYAGPEGGTADDPIGTIYIGYSSAHGAWVQRHHFFGDREKIRCRAVNAALDWVRRKLNHDKVSEVLSHHFP